MSIMRQYYGDELIRDNSFTAYPGATMLELDELVNEIARARLKLEIALLN